MSSVGSDAVAVGAHHIALRYLSFQFLKGLRERCPNGKALLASDVVEVHHVVGPGLSAIDTRLRFHLLKELAVPLPMLLVPASLRFEIVLVLAAVGLLRHPTMALLAVGLSSVLLPLVPVEL